MHTYFPVNIGRNALSSLDSSCEAAGSAIAALLKSGSSWTVAAKQLLQRLRHCKKGVNMDGIYFPGLGIFFKKVLSGFSVFGFQIKFYGMIIMFGFIFAYYLSTLEAKRTGQAPENYLDLLLTLVVPSILGARIYYILFNMKEFVSPGKSTGAVIKDMINIRNGGLAIYGGLIAGVITIIFFARHKKTSFPLVLDTITMGILMGQIMGRWGNFFNREVFGSYTNSIFRMGIPVDYYSKSFMDYLTSSGIVTDEMLAHQEVINGVSCITVHPTFLYEGLWNVLLLVLIFIFRKKKKFNGEIFTSYALGYGVGRFIIEGIRTDSLMIGPLKVSQVVAVLCVVGATIIIIVNRRKVKNAPLSETEKVEESGENTEKTE